MQLKEITLLSLEEHEKYKSITPSSSPTWWWLKTPYPGYDDAVRVIGDGGFLHIYSCFNYGGVRPFCIFNLESTDSLFWYKPEALVGSKIEYGKFKWTILSVDSGELHALCDEIIAEHRFDGETNKWEDSEIKMWLETEGIRLITA